MLLALAVGGCQLQPWKVGEVAHLHSPKTASTIDRTDRNLGLQIAMAAHAADNQALADTMHALQQLGDSNPVAQRKLLAELDQSKPELWPLVVQQFRSSLAYHEELVAAEKRATTLAAAQHPAQEQRGPQRWPGEPAADIQASYVPPPDEANPRPTVEQAMHTVAEPPETSAPNATMAPPVMLCADSPENHVEESRDSKLLQLHHLTFCKNVYGYGAYEPYGAAPFSPADQVLLYVEVENYHSESSDGGFVTKLGAAYQILDDRGERVAGGDFPDVEDNCRSRRRDFNIQYGLVLPEQIAPGKYELRLAMCDLESDQVGQATIAFEIGGREP